MNAQLALGAAVGLLVGLGAALAIRVSDRGMRSDGTRMEPTPALQPGIAAVLSVLPWSAVVLSADGVLRSSTAARARGLVAGGHVRVPGLLALVRLVRRHGDIRAEEIELSDGQLLGVHVAPLGGIGQAGNVLVLAEDLTEARRVANVRRDFVANVSHELKTPVGALGLLADTVEAAADDPDAVRHFAGRMRTEADRLGRLVQEVVLLSRLEGDGVLTSPAPLHLDAVVAEAIDRCRLHAAAKEIRVVAPAATGVEVVGEEDLLVVALRNIMDNAIAYSPSGTTVRVRIERADGYVEIAVADEGIGIPVHDRDRIFERFYRVDSARSRSTGGTGLGLAIVKHVTANHGGEVRVRSEEGQGSTFTVRLPVHGAPARPDRPVAAGSEVVAE